LATMGHSADRVHDQGLSGATDEVVWSRVITEGRFFITLDLDFSDVRRFPVGSHPGILLLRPVVRGVNGVQRILDRVVKEQPLESLRGCLAVADDHHTRIRRPASTDSGSDNPQIK
jgi:predicted nuclease of predicted toxin-antitoxin system